MDRDGLLLKELLVEHEVTAAIVRRIFHEAAAGKSNRAIAYDLQRDGIPTPSGRAGVRWEQGTISYILNLSLYWGVPVALRTLTIPVPLHLRATPARPRGPTGERLYKHKTREIRRDAAGQVTLPAAVAPALVSRDVADAVHARLAWNRQHAAALLTAAEARGQHDYQALLAGGFALCGGCDGAISVHHLPSTRCCRVASRHPVVAGSGVDRV